MKASVLASLCLSLGLSGILFGPITSAFASEEHPPQLRIYGGEPTNTCEWPTTLGMGYCTGTLVHPRILLTAAHCGSPKKVYLGEKYKGGIAKTVTTKYCEKNRRYSSYGRGGDSQYCVLNESIDDIPIAPIAFGCELDEIKAGADIWLVGFGENDALLRGSGVKHKVEVKINKVLGDHVELLVGGNGKATCYGDSGGPAYLKMSDGTWRTVGITSYGTSKKCGYPSGLTTASSAVKWIQASLNKRGEDIDLQPCYDDNGKWKPTAKCGGFALEPGKAFGAWENLCSEGAPRSGMSSICGPAAKGGDFPEGEAKLQLSWGEDMPSSPSIEEGESLKLAFVFKGPSAKVDHIAAVLDDKVVAKGKIKGDLLLENLEAGEYSLKLQARDEDDEVLAQTKKRTLKVKETADSESPDPSPDEGESDSGGDKNPSSDGSPNEDDGPSEAPTEQDSEQDSGQGSGKVDGSNRPEGPEDRGCQLYSASGRLGDYLAALAGLLLLGWRRKR